ncbi:hypothetical protein [Nonomuraea sp. KM90]|uniref:hypothetical protein n=1 Tax=Nonomuraea sp. KM90 TaxID=3457428 RepID=UPI003FCD9816
MIDHESGDCRFTNVPVVQEGQPPEQNMRRELGSDVQYPMSSSLAAGPGLIGWLVLWLLLVLMRFRGSEGLSSWSFVLL